MSDDTWRVIIAPDSFKGSIDARRAAEAIAEGWRTVRPHDTLVLSPMADGGEGTLDAFAAAVDGAMRMPVTVVGPHDTAVEAHWLLLPAAEDAPGGTAVVELASTSGIELLGSARHPLTAHTRGFGQAISAALDHGVSRLVLGIGSSASTDLGLGMLTELGARFVDRDGARVAFGAQGVLEVASVDLSNLRRMPTGGVTVLTDVVNPLTGSRGAAHVFGPQKGLSPAQVVEVDAAMARAARLLDANPASPGAGAAGGVGFALLTWGAELVSGAAAVSELTGLADAIAAADYVITGEGSFDAQSAGGKAPAIVAEQARAAGVPVALVAGRVARSGDLSRYHRVISLSELAGAPEASLASPQTWLRAAGRELAGSA